MLRYQKLRQVLPSETDGLLTMQGLNRSWLTGFTGSSGMVVTGREHRPVLLTDFRYTQQATAQASDFQVIQTDRDSLADLLNVLQQQGIKRLGFEKDFITFAQYKSLESKLEGVELVPLEDIVLNLRSIKDEVEIELLSQAVAIADQAFTHILGFLKPGLTERQVALELEHFMQSLGADGASFEIIVASGPRSSLPHGVATDRVLGKDEFVKLDFGCRYQGYCSDMTRTVVLGRADEKQREVYDIVREAQEAAVRGIRAGITGKEADALARDLITARGYGEMFGHGLGHGIGKAVHELPGVGSQSEKILPAGSVVTVEPGIYIPEWGGVRIEDMVVVQEGGCLNLTKSSKELVEL